MLHIKRKKIDNSDFTPSPNSSSSSSSSSSSGHPASGELKKSNFHGRQLAPHSQFLSDEALLKNINELLEIFINKQKEESASLRSFPSFSRENSPERKIQVEEGDKKDRELPSMLLKKVFTSFEMKKELQRDLQALNLDFKEDSLERSLLEKAFSKAIKCNLVDLLESFVNKGFQVLELCDAPPDEILAMGLADSLMHANSATLKKLLSFHFHFKQIPPAVQYACGIKAIGEDDCVFIKHLHEAGVNFTHEVEGENSILKHLLLNNLRAAHVLFSTLRLEIPNRGKHYFLAALEERNFESALFISRKDQNFNSKSTRTSLLNALACYVIEDSKKTEELIRFCVEICDINTKSTCQRVDWESYANYGLIKGKSCLLAHAVRAGRESLYPLLRVDEENVTLNLHAYLEHILQSRNLGELLSLEDGTATFMKLGALLNFNFSKGEDPVHDFTLITRCCVELVKRDSEEDLPRPERNAILKYLYFLIKQQGQLDLRINEQHLISYMLSNSAETFPDDFIADLGKLVDLSKIFTSLNEQLSDVNTRFSHRKQLLNTLCNVEVQSKLSASTS